LVNYAVYHCDSVIHTVGDINMVTIINYNNVPRSVYGGYPRAILCSVPVSNIIIKMFKYQCIQYGIIIIFLLLWFATIKLL